MKVQINIIDKLNPNGFKGQEGTFYSASIDIINNTDSVVRFWVMTCSWQDNWIFNTNTISLYNQGCDKNYPIVTQIPPGQKLTYYGIIHSIYALKQVKINDFKIGFALIKKHDILNMSDFRNVLLDKIKKRKDIVWSDSFKINK